MIFFSGKLIGLTNVASATDDAGRYAMAFLKRSKDPFSQIQSCLQKRDYRGALVWFKPLLDKDSKNTQVRLRYADTLVLAGSKREAIKQYRVVADELAEAGFMIRAIAINKKIVQLDPSQSDVHQKLAEMNEERSRTANAKSGLPLQMATTAPPPKPIAEEPSVAAIGVEEVGIEEIGMEEVGEEEIGIGEMGVEETPASVEAGAPDLGKEPDADVVEPSLSLDESMAMEFGEALPEPAAEPSLGDEAVELELEGVEDEPVTTPESPEGVGFELSVDEDAEFSFEETPAEPGVDSVELELTEEPGESGEEPVLEPGAPGLSFEEEPVVAADEQEISAEPEEELELTLEDVEPEPTGELEGLDVAVAAPEEGPAEELELEGEPELDFDIETEPDMAADGKDALVGLLGEDIDSMIDSIIDDVGSSVSGTQPPPPKAATRIPLFSDLTADEFVDVAIMLARRSVKAGTVIVKEGDPGDSMFIVCTGEVEATREDNGETIKLATLCDGDFFGEMAVLSGEPRSATVTVVKNTELLELSRSDLNTICSRHPHVEAKLRLAYDERSMRNR